MRLESFGETRGMNPSYLPQERRVVLRRVLILVFYVYVYFVKAPYVLVCMLQVIRRGHRECERGVKVKCKGQGQGGFFLFVGSLRKFVLTLPLDLDGRGLS